MYKIFDIFLVSETQIDSSFANGQKVLERLIYIKINEYLELFWF